MCGALIECNVSLYLATVLTELISTSLAFFLQLLYIVYLLQPDGRSAQT